MATIITNITRQSKKGPIFTIRKMNAAKTPISSTDVGLNQFKMNRSYVRANKQTNIWGAEIGL